MSIYVSTHVPVKDTTCLLTSFKNWKNCFNPRTRKGYDFAPACVL